MSKEMAKMGYMQGDMKPVVEDFHKPEDEYSQRGFSKTTDYIERQNKFQHKEAKEVEKQAYMGRYS